jgi:membrane protein
MSLWTDIKKIFHTYFSRNGPLLAKGIAYTFLITVIPLLLISLSVIVSVFRLSPDLQATLRFQLQNLIPAQVADFLLDQMIRVAKQRSWMELGIIGSLGLLLVPRTFFSSVETALATVMDAPTRRPLLKRQLLFLSLTLLAIALFFTATYIHIIVGMIWKFMALEPQYELLGRKTFSLLLVWSSLVLLYRVCYHGRLHLAALLIVSLVVAVLWQGLNTLGSSFITASGKNQLVYGILAGGIVFLTWSYLFAMLLLLGGITMAHFGGARRHRPAIREFTAVQFDPTQNPFELPTGTMHMTPRHQSSHAPLKDKRHR